MLVINILYGLAMITFAAAFSGDTVWALVAGGGIVGIIVHAKRKANQ